MFNYKVCGTRNRKYIENREGSKAKQACYHVSMLVFVTLRLCAFGQGHKIQRLKPSTSSANVEHGNPKHTKTKKGFMMRNKAAPLLKLLHGCFKIILAIWDALSAETESLLNCCLASTELLDCWNYAIGVDQDIT